MVFVAIEIPMPFSKATDPDTLIGLQMNGAPLPVDHGAPARMIVTGGIGTGRVKWVGWLTVSSGETRYFRNDESYVIDGQTVTQQNIKSKLWLPVPAQLSLGPQVITGFARGAGDEIARVEWSVNGWSVEGGRANLPGDAVGWDRVPDPMARQVRSAPHLHPSDGCRGPVPVGTSLHQPRHHSLQHHNSASCYRAMNIRSSDVTRMSRLLKLHSIDA